MTIREIAITDDAALAAMIRKVFEEHDAPRLGTVYSDPTTDHLFELFRMPRSVLFVCEMDNKVAGCCGIYPTPGLTENCAELVKFYLAAEARGKGIGKALMQQSLTAARNFGYTELYLESLPQFSKAVSIYENSGFVRLTKPLGTSGHVSCNIWMIKKL